MMRIFSFRLMPLFGLYLLFFSSSALLAQAVTDELRLRDGKVLHGQALEFNGEFVSFRTDAGIQTYKRVDCAALFFGGAEIPLNGLPPGVSTAEGLTISRWTTWRQITHLEATGMNAGALTMKMSADGSRIAYTNKYGLFTVKSDGTNLTKIVDDAVYKMDISADGNTVAWYQDDKGISIAKSDGTGKRKLEGGYFVQAIRMSADAKKLIVLAPDRGLLMLPMDGSTGRRIVTTAQVAKVANTDNNNNHWRGAFVGSDGSAVDISDDGSRIVFQFKTEAMAVNLNGTDIRRLTDFGDKDNVRLVRISGDGRRVAYYVHREEDSELVIMDWDGGNRNVYTGKFFFNIYQLRLTYDGSSIIAGNGAIILSGIGHHIYEPLTGTRYPYLLDTVTMPSISADGKRGCCIIFVPGVTQLELVVFDLNPTTLNGAPALANINVSSRSLSLDGATKSTLTTQASGGEEITIWQALMRNGMVYDPEVGFFEHAVNYEVVDNGNLGDEKAGDGIFTSNQLRLSFWFPKHQPEPGPMTMRLVSWNKANCGLSLDIEGMEANNP